MSNILKPELHLHTKQFHWDKFEETFSAESSELRTNNENRIFPIGKFWEKLGRVYDDACDLGFTFISHKTGRTLTMVVNDIDKSDDHSDGFKSVEFIPAEPEFKKSFRVLIFND